MVSVLDTNQTIRERCMPAKIDLIPSMATPTSSKISAGYGRTYALEFYYGKDMKPSRGRTLEF
jgi:hypothetical protein